MSDQVVEPAGQHQMLASEKPDRWRIERDDEEGKFASDEEAIAHVQAEAASGDKLAWLSYELHKAHQQLLAQGKQMAVFHELLREVEPRWATHPASVWNRARRAVERLNGKEISEAMSWNAATSSWQL